MRARPLPAALRPRGPVRAGGKECCSPRAYLLRTPDATQGFGPPPSPYALHPSTPPTLTAAPKGSGGKVGIGLTVLRRLVEVDRLGICSAAGSTAGHSTWRGMEKLTPQGVGGAAMSAPSLACAAPLL